MALVKGALNILKTQVLTSIHGRKLGVDHNGFVVGHPGQRLPYENSTAASTLANYGVSYLSGTTAAWTLGAPPSINAEKTIINASSISTATLSIVRSSSDSGVTFAGSTANGGGGVRINLLNSGAAITLIAQSSLAWAVKNTATFGSTPYVSVSTSS